MLDPTQFEEIDRPLIDTIVAFARDPDPFVWMDRDAGLLYVHITIAGSSRKLAFDHLSINELGMFDDNNRAKAIATLFAGAAAWPAGAVFVRAVGPARDWRSNSSKTGLCAFIRDLAVSDVVLISSKPERR